ncbi:MAG TPA: metal-dependent transcriptional regulator [Spirochaetia bacterium]|nr:metal-dependent transcriptional regulator [Spirochaetales bacterium]HRY71877.1 metal-dependent transcriptional regulator [Spirochaetia bacterium]
MTESLEMYLETISLLHDRSRIARVTDIAAELGVSKPSVHTALHELERRGLIEHEHYGEVFLTQSGKAASAAIRERHGLLTAFLRDFLGVSPAVAEQDACRMEHILSEETMARIAERTRGAAAAGRGGSAPGAAQPGPAEPADAARP